jgi:hypothetical protein
MECEEDGLLDCNPKPDPCKNSDWVVHVKRTKLLTESAKNCGILCFTLLMLLLCIISYVFCQECLFVLLIVSACLCPFFHPLNAPLWLAIVLLTVGGWSFTAGAMEIRWKSQ